MTHCATAAVNFVQFKDHALFPMENSNENILKTFKKILQITGPISNKLFPMENKSENIMKTFKSDSPDHWAISTKLGTKHPWLKGDSSLFK